MSNTSVHSIIPLNIRQFMKGHADGALWSSTDTQIIDGKKEDVNLDLFEWAGGELEKMTPDCIVFIRNNADDLLEYTQKINEDNDTGNMSPWEMAGYDFWLTRMGHGVGYWDRGLDDLGERLAEAARKSPHSGIYLGDDDLVYCS